MNILSFIQTDTITQANINKDYYFCILTRELNSCYSLRTTYTMDKNVIAFGGAQRDLMLPSLRRSHASNLRHVLTKPISI